MADDQVFTPAAGALNGAPSADTRGSKRLPTRLVIVGEQAEAAAGATRPVINPATEQVLAQMALKPVRVNLA
jgi:hypothetical protein